MWRDMGAGVKRLTDIVGFETSNVGDWLWWRWSFSRGEAEEEMELPDDLKCDERGRGHAIRGLNRIRMILF